MEKPRLPYEMLCKICYEHKGLTSKSALCIQEYMKEEFKKECFICERNNLSLSLCPIYWIKFEERPSLKIKKLKAEKLNQREVYLCWHCAHS